MARLSKTEATYNDILNNPAATVDQRLEASRLLDAHRKQKVVRERFSKSRKLLGLKVRDPKFKAISELPEFWRGTAFSRETWPNWTKEQRDEWLAVNKLEN
jgi:hypothetical protein